MTFEVCSDVKTFLLTLKIKIFSEANSTHPNRFEFAKEKIILRSKLVDTDPDAEDDPFRQENKFRYEMTKVS